MGSASAQAPRRVIGRYELFGELASGGMATVHLGRLLGPAGFSPTVAIKSLHPQFAKDPSFVAMFLDEARLAARIRHPNVVPVMDVHATDAQLFLVLEYVHGESLSRLLHPGGPDGQEEGAPPAIASAILCGVLQGLHAAHEAKGEGGTPLGIVHRDVSPQNILVGADGVARVLDFGVAKAVGRSQTTADGQIKGKIAYMAPEQLRAQEVTRRVDIYAVAVVLWETLTGRRLFKGPDQGSTLAKVFFEPVAKPSELVPKLPAALDAVVMRGLSRESSERFATAREMAVALQAAMPPAPAATVEEWVLAKASVALSDRAARVAQLEAQASSRVSEGSGASGVREASPLAAGSDVPTEADAGGSQLSSLSVSYARGAPRPGRTLAPAIIVLAVVGLGSVLVWRSMRAAVQAPAAAASAAIPTSESVAPAAPLPAAPSPEPPTISAADSARPVAPATSAAPPRAPTPSTRPAGHRPPPVSAAQAASSPSPPMVAPVASARCSHRNPDGTIEFNLACLRGGQ